MKTIGRLGLMVALAAAIVSCKTGGPEEPPQPPPKEPYAFRAARALSELHFEQGPYPAIFAPSSYALWVDEDVTALRRKAALEAGETITPTTDAEVDVITRDYVIVECHLDSLFADMSIAYDVVGCRGLSVYLTTPDGRQIAPIQTLIGTSLKEEPQDALKLFGRTNLIVFPKRDLWLDTPLVGPDAPSVRLVLEAHKTSFYFEWPALKPDVVPEPKRTSDEIRAVLQTGFKAFHERVQRLAYVFK